MTLPPTATVAERHWAGRQQRGLAVDVKVILTPSGIFSKSNR
jgi:hypothetical protein